jgi:arylsulfatase A-like enzyme
MKVVWCVVDCLRYDALSINGYSRPTTTAIDDRLAADFVSFEDACTQSAFTLSVISSLLTGTYPSTHGALRFDSELPQNIPTFREMSSDTFGKIHVIPGMDFVTGGWGIERCFDKVHDLRTAKDERASSQARANEVRNNAEDVLRNYDDFLSLLWFFDLHTPWLGTKQFSGPNTARDRYDSELQFVASEIESLCRTLESRGEYEETMIILTGDHGDIFRETSRFDGIHLLDDLSTLPGLSYFAHDDYLGHLGRPLLDELLHVPLFVKFPGNDAGGERIYDQVELIDILPTILDVADGDIAESVEGESLFPMLDGGNGKEYVFAEMEANRADGLFRCVRDPQYKLLQHIPPTELTFEQPHIYAIRRWLTKEERFLARADERRDLPTDNVRAAQLRRVVNEWVKRPGSNEESASQELSTGQREQLESLGYL